jgi:hypothetical protein
VRVEWAFFCTSATVDDLGQLTIFAPGVTKGYHEASEQPISLKFIMCVESPYEEATSGVTKRVDARVYGPDMAIIKQFYYSLPLEVQNPEHYSEGWMGHSILDCDLRLRAVESGHYVLELQSDTGEPVTVNYQVERYERTEG